MLAEDRLSRFVLHVFFQLRGQLHNFLMMLRDQLFTLEERKLRFSRQPNSIPTVTIYLIDRILEIPVIADNLDVAARIIVGIRIGFRR